MPPSAGTDCRADDGPLGRASCRERPFPVFEDGEIHGMAGNTLQVFSAHALSHTSAVRPGRNVECMAEVTRAAVDGSIGHSLPGDALGGADIERELLLAAEVKLLERGSFMASCAGVGAGPGSERRGGSRKSSNGVVAGAGAGWSPATPFPAGASTRPGGVISARDRPESGGALSLGGARSRVEYFEERIGCLVGLLFAPAASSTHAVGDQP